ncbi:hypothetical protein B0T20DRAFT_441313 [Sordaria brevicollis]|uniref:Defect at low temperature protein 1 n=1 Tax=Sordaria brevicollis TaxID=83679 RepID=A0AAE0UAW5_SORBR|nr:hypothetical protein B0T20DRAFT_441313 [Sordaria brevicollis]
MKSAVSIIAHFLYKLVYYFIYLVLLAFLIVSPIDLIRQAIITKQNYSILIVALCYLVTILIVVFIYATRLYYNKAVLDSIPKSWIPIDKGDVPRDVRQLIVAGLSRSAAIAYEARPRLPLPFLSAAGAAAAAPGSRATAATTNNPASTAANAPPQTRDTTRQRDDNGGQDGEAHHEHGTGGWIATAAKEASKEAADRFTGKRSRWKPKVRRGISADTVEGRESEHTSTVTTHPSGGPDEHSVSINIVATPPRGGPHIWGEIEHPGWASPTCPDLANVQFDTVIQELPNLIEAKAITLAPPDRMSEGEGEGGGGMEPPLLDPDAVALLQRHESMGLREYLTSLTELGVVTPSEALGEFIKLYERARYSTRPLSIDEFRRLMHVFAEVLRSMRPLDPVVLDEIVGGEYDEDDDGAGAYHDNPEGHAHNDGTTEGDDSNNRRFFSPYSQQDPKQQQPSPHTPYYESDIDNDAPRRSYSSGDLRRDSDGGDSMYQGENDPGHYFASRHQQPPRTPTPKTPQRRKKRKTKYTAAASSSSIGPSPSPAQGLTRQKTNSSSSSSLRSSNHYLRPETAKTHFSNRSPYNPHSHPHRSTNRNSSGTYSSTVYSWQQQQRQFRTAPTTPRSAVVGLYRAATNGTGISPGGVSELELGSAESVGSGRGNRSGNGDGRSVRSGMSGGSNGSNGSSGSSGSVIRLAQGGDQTDLPYVLMPPASSRETTLNNNINNNASLGSLARASDDDDDFGGQQGPIKYFIGDIIDPDEVFDEVEEFPLPPHPPIVRPITPATSERYPGQRPSAEEGGGVAPQPGATRQFSDTEVLAYVSMRGVTSRGHSQGDEALEPLARVMYEPRPLRGVSGARTVSLGQEASTMLESVAEEMGSDGDEPVEEESAAQRGEEMATRPLEIDWAERAQHDNRHISSNDGTKTYLQYQGYRKDQEYDQDYDTDRGKSTNFELVQGTQDDEGKSVARPGTPPSPVLGLSENPFYQISPFGYESRGRFYQSHSAITEVSERTSRADLSVRKVSNGSSHASDGSANSGSNESSGSGSGNDNGGIFSTPSTPPKNEESAWVKTTGLLPGDVSDDEDIDAGAISPRTFLKLAQGCGSNRAFRVGGPAKFSFPISTERMRPKTPSSDDPEHFSSSPSQHEGQEYQSQYDEYDGDEITGIYSVSSNPSIKWTATKIDHFKFAGRIENFTFERMDPLSGLELARRRYDENVIGKDFEDDADEDSGSIPIAPPDAIAARPSTPVLEDGSRPVTNINDYSPVRVPWDDKPVYVYVGDMPPRVNIDERNIPPFRKTVRFSDDPKPKEQKVKKMVSVPPGFENQFSVHARELGKGKMVADANTQTVTATHGYHNIDWKGKGPEIIFDKSLSSPSSGSSLEMTELKAGPPPKLADYPAGESEEAGPSHLPHAQVDTPEAGPSHLPYAQVETIGYDEAEAAITHSTVPLAFGIPGKKAREWLDSHNKVINDMKIKEKEMRRESASLALDVEELERIRPLLKALIAIELHNCIRTRLAEEVKKDPLAFGGLFDPETFTRKQFRKILKRITSQPLPALSTIIKPSEPRNEPDDKPLDPARADRIRGYFNDQMIQLKFKLDAQDAAITTEEHRQAQLIEEKDKKITQIGEILEEFEKLGVEEDSDTLFAEAQAEVKKEMAEEEERRVKWAAEKELKWKCFKGVEKKE